MDGREEARSICWKHFREQSCSSLSGIIRSTACLEQGMLPVVGATCEGDPAECFEVLDNQPQH